MKKNQLAIWKEKLKEDLYFMANLKLYMISYRSEENGIAIRNGQLTNTFKEWLNEQSIGPILLSEITRRRNKIDRI